MRSSARLLAFGITLLPLAVAPARAQDVRDARVTLTARHPRTLRTDPGKVVSAVFEMANGSPRGATVRPRVGLPDGWRLLTGETPLTLEAGQSDAWVVGFTVPAATPPGRYVVGLLADVEPPNTAPLRDSLAVDVAERRQIELSVLDAPRFIAAGDSGHVRFILHNRGNAAAALRLSASGTEGIAADASAALVSLEAGETRTVPVAAAAPRRIDRSASGRVELHAEHVADSTVSATASSEVAIVPRGDASGGSILWFPMYLRARTATGDDAVAPVELSGSGPLADGGPELDVLLRGPGPSHSLLGERDEYRLGLRTAWYELRLGDQYFAASPLTQSGRQQFGAGGSIEVGPFTLGGFADRNRRLGTPDAEWGSSVAFRPWGAAQVGLNYVDRDGFNAGSIWSVQSTLTPVRNSLLNLEHAFGAGPLGRGNASSARLSGNHERLSYDVQHLHGDPAFPGLQRATNLDFASLRLRLWRSLQLGGYANRQSADYTAAASPFEQRLTAFGTTVGYADRLTVELRRGARDGRFGTTAFDVREDALRVWLGHNHRAVSLSGSAELGSTWDQIAADRSGFHKLSVASSVAVGSRLSYSVFADYSSGRTLYSSVPQQAVSAGVDASALLFGATRARLSAYGGRWLAPGSVRYGQLDARLEQGLRSGRTLSLRARMSAFGVPAAAQQRVLYFEYGMPLRVPAGRARTADRVTGRIIDGETGRGLPGALVYLGDQMAITDGAGNVAFSGVAPGTYHLGVDADALDGGRVMTGRPTLEIAHSGGEGNRFAVGVVRGARVRGAVHRFEFTPSPQGEQTADSLVDAGGVPNVVVVLAGELDTLRQLTDSRGEFETGGLRPGRYTLTVLRADVPLQHVVEPESLVLNADPGQTEYAEFRLVPKRRAIRMLTIGELRLEPESPLPSPPAPRSHSLPERRVALPRRHTVRRGDCCLWRIAKAVYGNASLWPRIWLANRHRIPDPDQLHPGQRLLIPEPTPLSRREWRRLEAVRRRARSTG